ncbi:hypothetical protein [Stigmatella hybrida]|uniref:hypothetical protein n=1 Tax=Stigmatella hybrida TaxID=394097 RepID=UPI001CDABB3D|nr:hypothetical protein [Stigmatella hybrida]
MKFVKHVRVWVALGVVSMSMGCAGEADVPAEPRPQAQQTVQALEILEPTVDLSTYTVYTVAERQGHPEAGEPEYAFLATGLDALKVDGPLLAADSGLFVLDGAGIQKHPEAKMEDSPYTFRVTVNPRLSFDVKMYDYDHEVALAAVKLIPQGASFQSVFVFSTSQVDEGVAHDLVITPFIDGVAGTPTAPVSIESRFVASAPLEIFNPSVDLSAYTQYEPWELTGHPDAENPWEPYLQGGVQAVKVDGPGLEPVGLFVLDGAEIQKHPAAGSGGAPYAFRVTVNPRLSFEVKFSAYGHEVELAGVKLFTRGPYLQSVFIFSGSPVAEGVARKLVITPFIDGVADMPTTPMTIESRL